MKKLLFMFAAMLTVVLVGCKKGAQDAEPEEIKLSVDPSSINSPAFGADYLLTLTAPDAWTAECADSWVKVNPTSGNAGTVEISVKISANKESAESSSKIVFKSGDKTLEVPVKRAAKDPARLKVSNGTNIRTPQEGGRYTIRVESNIKWQASSSNSWAKIQGDAVKRGDGNIIVAVDPATMPEETTATITIKPFGEGTEAGEQTVIITRGSTEATSMSIDKEVIDATSEGGSFKISVQSTAKWRATKSWDADWITLYQYSGNGNGTFEIKVDAATTTDDASTIVYITEERPDDYEPVQLQVLVNRAGKANASLSVSPQMIDAPATGGDYPIEIKSNYAWTATAIGVKILSISTTKGDGDATLIVTVKPTLEGYEQTGSVIIKSSFGGEEATIKVRQEKRQEKPYLTLDKEEISAAPGTTVVVLLSTNVAWTAVSSKPGVATVNPPTGVGSQDLRIHICGDDESVTATADITVQTTDGLISRTIKVTRQGK